MQLSELLFPLINPIKFGRNPANARLFRLRPRDCGNERAAVTSTEHCSRLGREQALDVAAIVTLAVCVCFTFVDAADAVGGLDQAADR